MEGKKGRHDQDGDRQARERRWPVQQEQIERGDVPQARKAAEVIVIALHPPIREIRVDVVAQHPLTQGLGTSFTVEDEPYFIELTDPAATQILLTTEYGPSAVGATNLLYESDTSLQSDGKTRVLGYTRPVGKGAVTYYAFGHCHNPAIRAARASQDPADTTPPVFRGPWESGAVNTLLRNAIAWR